MLIKNFIPKVCIGHDKNKSLPNILKKNGYMFYEYYCHDNSCGNFLGWVIYYPNGSIKISSWENNISNFNYFINLITQDNQDVYFGNHSWHGEYPSKELASYMWMINIESRLLNNSAHRNGKLAQDGRMDIYANVSIENSLKYMKQILNNMQETIDNAINLYDEYKCVVNIPNLNINGNYYENYI